MNPWMIMLIIRRKKTKERKILILPGSAGNQTGMKDLRAIELTPVPLGVRKGTKLQSRTLNLGHTAQTPFFASSYVVL